MELHLTAAQKAQLAEVAAAQGRNPDLIAHEILGNGLEAEAKFIEAVRLGEADAAAGNFVTHEEVCEWVKGLAKTHAG